MALKITISFWYGFLTCKIEKNIYFRFYYVVSSEVFFKEFVDKNGQKNGQKWSKMVKNCQKWPMAYNSQTGKNTINTRLCQNGKKTDFQKSSKMANQRHHYIQYIQQTIVRFCFFLSYLITTVSTSQCLLKVSYFQNVLLVSKLLPKNQQIFFHDFCPSL